MPLIVKKNEALDPVDVRLLGPVTVMPHPDRLTDLVKQSRLPNRRHRLNSRFGIQSAIDHSKRASCRRVRINAVHNALRVMPVGVGKNSLRVKSAQSGR